MNQSNSSNQREYPVVKTGGIANPAEVKRAILEATKDVKRADRDFDKLIADKEELLADLAELRIHEKQAEEKILPASVKKVIERSVRSLQKRLSILNGVLPEVNFSADQKKIQTIITEWKEGKRSFRNAYGAHLRAERKLAENPADHRAMGDANRAEAEMYTDTQKMDALAKESELIVGRTTPDPVTDEAVNIHTAPLKSFVMQGEIKEKRGQEPFFSDMSAVERKAPDPFSPSEESEEQMTFTNLLPPSVELPAPSAYELLEESEYRESQEETKETMSVPVPAVQPEEVLEVVVPEIPEEVPEQREVERETPEPLPIEPEVSVQPEVSAMEYEEPISVPTPVEDNSETKEVPEEETMAIEAEKSPSRAYAEKMLHSHLDTLFGVKGFLGFGEVLGKDSPHWSDVERGFEKKIIDEVRTASPVESAERIGMENANEVAKMRAYIEKAQNETGVPPLPDESVSDYIIRALSMTYENTQ